MDQLPPELLTIIFKNLNHKNKRNCKLVCKKFNFVIQNLKEECLVVLISDSRRKLHHLNWFYTNKRTSNSRILISKEYDFLSTELIKTKCSNLKKLFIYIRKTSYSDSKAAGFNFERNVNKFNQLEELNIYNANMLKDATIRLPNLKIGKIHFDTNGHKLTLNCVKLRIFSCFHFNRSFVFTYPEKITHLEIDGFYREVNSNERNQKELEIYQFVNLEYIVFNHHNVGFKGDSFTRFAKLKEYHYNKFSTIGGFLDARRSNRELLKVKERLVENDFKIYFSGLDSELIKNFEEKELHTELMNGPNSKNHLNQTTLCTKYYNNLIQICPSIRKINYNELLDFYKDELPSDFFTRMPNIQKVFAREVADEKAFLKFLSKCNLIKLDLRRTFKKQQSYDSLPKVCPFIVKFYPIELSGQIKIDFILKFSYLSHLILYRKLDYEFVNCLFENLEEFYQITLPFDKDAYYRLKKEHDEFEAFDENSNRTFVNSNLNDLFKEMKEFHS